jgi:Na+-translocating ferredoxin:NAD+ oxidoreductase RnfG subunit
MIINKLISFYFILLGGILFGGSPIRDTAEKYIISQFDVDVSINMHTFKLGTKLKAFVQNKVKQRFYRDELYYWTISNNDTTIAYALMDNVLGKSMPITFLVIMGIDGRIINLDVIKYREAYGGEVDNKNWLAQFTNSTDTSQFTVGKNIDGISGATISVNSLSKGIQKIAVLFPLIKDRLY